MVMKDVIYFLFVLALGAIGISPVGACSLALSKAEAVKTGPDSGEVRVRISNGGCPEGSVHVSVLPLSGTVGTKQNLKVTGWDSNTKDVALPPHGLSTKDQVMKFKVEGTGAMRFQVSIDACNKTSCKDIGWEPSPKILETKSLDFP